MILRVVIGWVRPSLNTIVRFINRKFCYEALEEKADLKNVNNHNLGFESNTKLFLSENLTNNWLGCVGN